MATDIWESIKGIVCTVAPILGNAIVPGLGGVAGSILASILGVDPNDPKKIEESLKTASPDVWAKIKEAEMKHEETLVQISADLEKARYADIQSARTREVEVTKATGKLNTPLYILASIVTLGFFGTLIASMIWPITDNNQATIMLIGVLGTGFGMVLQYFFGSSSSSGVKNSYLANSVTPDMLVQIMTQLNGGSKPKQSVSNTPVVKKKVEEKKDPEPQPAVENDEEEKEEDKTSDEKLEEAKKP